MKIDKSKMSADELKQLAEFEKKYGVQDETPADKGGAAQAAADSALDSEGMAKANNTGETDARISGEQSKLENLHPEVAKALSEVEEMKKTATAEIAEMKKSLEMERLTTFAKKYEVLGKKSDELAPKLYELKKAGGTAYDDYVSLLDEQASLFEKSGIFGEVGKNTYGSPDAWGKLETIAKSIVTRDGITIQQAIEKAGVENPELLAEYRKER